MQFVKSFCFFNIFLLSASLNASDQPLIKSTEEGDMEPFNLPLSTAAQQLEQKGTMLEQAIAQHFEQTFNQPIKEFVDSVRSNRVDFGYKTAIAEDNAAQHRILVYNNINARYNNTPYDLLVLAISIGKNTQVAMLSDGNRNFETKTLPKLYSFKNSPFLEGQQRLANKSKFKDDDKKFYELGETILKDEFKVDFLKPASWYAWGKSYFNSILLALGFGAVCFGAYCYVKGSQK